MTREQIKMIDDTIESCVHGVGIEYLICDINGCYCGDNVNNGKCPTLSRLFGEEYESE